MTAVTSTQDYNLAVYTQQARTFDCVVTGTATNINTDAPTNTVLLVKAGAKGGVIPRLRAMPRATCTDTSLLLYQSRDNGVTQRLIDSEKMVGQTVATNAAVNETVFANYGESTPLKLGPNEALYAGSQAGLTAGIVFSGEILEPVAGS